jgi:hypothetical protein
MRLRLQAGALPVRSSDPLNMVVSLEAVAVRDIAAGAWLVVVIAVVVVQIVLFVAGVLSVLRSSRLTRAGR